ncbi:MAG: peptide chain release factor N(5)-glutamine methyltransferase [Pseudomonadota bacterium]
MTPTIAQAVALARETIAKRPFSDAMAEARLLVEAITGLSKTEQIAFDITALTREQADRLVAALARRAAGEPLARILGKAPFWDFEVSLNDATLIPRDDTGRLVEAALERISITSSPHVADLGTGSGIVLIALARERPHLTGLGIDSDARAVEQARSNARALGVSDRLAFRMSQWLQGVDERFDMIVSNPPYIRNGEHRYLQEEVRKHDPEQALIGGTDGLDAYRALLPQAMRGTVPGGWVIVEIGHTQADAVVKLGAQAGLSPVSTDKDLSGNDRVCIFRRP